MSNSVEIVEKLTQIVSSQSSIIRQLYNVVQQVNATTSIDEAVAKVLEEADKATGEVTL